MLRSVTQELSLPQQMEPLGLQGLLGHQIISGESPTETEHLLWWENQEPSSPHQTESHGLLGFLELLTIFGESPTETVHSSR